MKVLLVNSVCGFGSTGRITAGLAEMLIQNGDDALVAYGRKTGTDAIPSVKIGSTASKLLHLMMTRVFDGHAFWSKAATRRLIRVLDEFKPDIIHLHNLHGYYIHAGMLMRAIRERNIKVVWTLHDCWTFTGHCAHFEYIGCDKWKSGCRSCPQKKEYPASLVFDRSSRNYKYKKEWFNLPEQMTIVTPSDWLAKLVKASFLGQYPVKTIHTGIDHTVFNPTASDLKDTLNLHGKTVLLGVSSIFTDRKGLNDLIQLAKRLPNDYHIVLAGLAKTQMRGLPENITALPRQSCAEDMAKLYSMADVLVNPTKEDTFPTINLEALACGTPVITYDAGGCAEAVDESCGEVVRRDDIDGILSAVIRLKKNPVSQKSCIKRSKAFTLEKQLNEYHAAYCED